MKLGIRLPTHFAHGWFAVTEIHGQKDLTPLGETSAFPREKKKSKYPSRRKHPEYELACLAEGIGVYLFSDELLFSEQ